MVNNYLSRWPVPITFEKPGDQIKGELIAWDSMAEKYPVMHLRTADGFIRVVRLTQTRLLERMVDANPDIGDHLLIRYDGEAERAMPGLNKTKEFTVQIRRKDSQPPAEKGQKDGAQGAGK